MKPISRALIPYIVIAAALGLIAGALAGYYFGYDNGWENALDKPSDSVPTDGYRSSNFEECVAAGNPVMESYPRQCRTPDGRNFVEDIASNPYPPSSPPTTPPKEVGSCATAGCSSQLCVESSVAADIVTTCEFRSEYACYRTATCARQSNSECGWTQTPELVACLNNPPPME